MGVVVVDGEAVSVTLGVPGPGVGVIVEVEVTVGVEDGCSASGVQDAFT